MIRFRLGNETTLCLTLTENVTLDNPYYLFLFTHRTTRKKIRFVRSVGDDISGAKDRYNAFPITPDDFFTSKDIGQYQYTVYEQSSPDNTDESGLNVLETGICDVEAGQGFSYSQREADTTYKVRQ